MNPARDFGPRLTHFFLPIAGKGKSDWGYALIPIIAPLVGGAFGAASAMIFRY
jgi:glycerol uptake facilitator protein